MERKSAFKEKQRNFRAIGVIYPEVYQGVALKSSGIKTIDDLKGKRVAVGPVGSGTVVMTETVFTEAGLTFDDVKAAYDGFGDAASKMKDGHLDAAFNVLAVPAAAIQDIMTAREIEVIEIGDDLYQKIKAKSPFFSQYVIPAGTYVMRKTNLQSTVWPHFTLPRYAGGCRIRNNQGLV